MAPTCAPAGQDAGMQGLRCQAAQLPPLRHGIQQICYRVRLTRRLPRRPEVGPLQADVLQVAVVGDGRHEVPPAGLAQGVAMQQDALHHRVDAQSLGQHHARVGTHACAAQVHLLHGSLAGQRQWQRLSQTAMNCLCRAAQAWAQVSAVEAPTSCGLLTGGGPLAASHWYTIRTACCSAREHLWSIVRHWSASLLGVLWGAPMSSSTSACTGLSAECPLCACQDWHGHLQEHPRPWLFRH